MDIKVLCKTQSKALNMSSTTVKLSPKSQMRMTMNQKVEGGRACFSYYGSGDLVNPPRNTTVNNVAYFELLNDPVGGLF